jgi:hypothetical protein
LRILAGFHILIPHSSQADRRRVIQRMAQACPLSGGSMSTLRLLVLLAVMPAAMPIHAVRAQASDTPFIASEHVSWQGSPPGTRLPDPGQRRAARDACIHGKQGLRPDLSDPVAEASREDDPFTWTDITFYELDLEVFQGATALNGVVTLRLASRVDGLSEVLLHAASNLSITSVLQDNVGVPFTRSGQVLTVQLADVLDEGGTTALEIAYTAQFSGCGVLSTWRTNVQTGQGVHTITTQAEPFDARCWWPCKDDTRDKADSTLIRVTTNNFNTVVSNGVLRSNVDNGDGTRTATWFEGWPMVTYLVSLCVTEYNHQQTTWTWNEVSMPLHDWSWGLSTGDQQTVLAAGLMALDALSDWYGLYPFWNEKYGHAQYTWGGAMEHQTCSSMGFYNEAVIAHELSHQWFGDKITCDTFHHIWLNEGWATYSEALYFEHFLGQDALHEYMSYEAYWGPGTIFVENPYTDNIFDGNLSYAKGGWVVHMLRHVMGEEAFWAAVHAYLGPNERAFHRTADTDEFRAFMEAEHGDDLSWFFDQWIMGEYWPNYSYHWTVEPQGGGQLLTVALVQTQVPARQTFTMPIDLRVTFAGGGSETFVLFNDRAAQSFQLLLPSAPVDVDLDPDRWILRQVTELASPPPTQIVVTNGHLEDGAGQPLDRLPEGGAFRFAFELANMGALSGPLQLSVQSTHPGVEFLPIPAHPGLGFAANAAFLVEGSTQAGLSGMVNVALSVAWEGGDLVRSWLFPAGHPEVLLVDDDGGASYQTWFEDAMSGAIDFVTVTTEELPADLTGYGLVVWMTGNNRRALAAGEWAVVSDYVDGGGHLVFTGQNFADAQDAAALASHCGVEVLNPSYDNNAAVGTAGGIFADRTLYLFNGGAGNQSEMDVISGLLDCMAPQATYHNLATGSAAEELFCGDGGLMVFGFGLEGVAPIGNGLTLNQTLERLVAWSRGETSVEPPALARPGSLFSLAGAQPNPFNPTTRLVWESRVPGSLRGEVFNLAGQRVASFEPRQVGAGSGSLSWQPTGLASGLYLARLVLETRDGARHAATQKLMLLQ